MIQSPGFQSCPRTEGDKAEQVLAAVQGAGGALEELRLQAVVAGLVVLAVHVPGAHGVLQVAAQRVERSVFQQSDLSWASPPAPPVFSRSPQSTGPVVHPLGPLPAPRKLAGIATPTLCSPAPARRKTAHPVLVMETNLRSKNWDSSPYFATTLPAALRRKKAALQRSAETSAAEHTIPRGDMRPRRHRPCAPACWLPSTAVPAAACPSAAQLRWLHVAALPAQLPPLRRWHGVL